MEHVRKEMEKEGSKYVKREGLIYLKEQSGSFDRVAIPESLRAWILRMHHNIELAGHQGHKRVINHITQFCFWPGMARDTIRWVQGCVACKKRKTPRPLRQGITSAVFEIPKSHSRHRHCRTNDRDNIRKLVDTNN
jgi:hypothetical protein